MPVSLTDEVGKPSGNFTKVNVTSYSSEYTVSPTTELIKYNNIVWGNILIILPKIAVGTWVNIATVDVIPKIDMKGMAMNYTSDLFFGHGEITIDGTIRVYTKSTLNSQFQISIPTMYLTND